LGAALEADILNCWGRNMIIIHLKYVHYMLTLGL
jgi:hypothetical protein